MGHYRQRLSIISSASLHSGIQNFIADSWKKLQPKPETNSSKFQVSSSKGQSPAASYRNDTRRKLTYKEKTEFEQLERDIEALTAEKAAAEASLSSGTLSVDEITRLSERFQVISDELDEKEMRWLELSELQ